jgi:bifunctional DNA-binding transcriptional regulator/antitoxin component of YhaV-PrlF toxin-antitoxin module
MARTEVKNRRLKMSPGGVIDLPVAARKALGLEKGQGGRVTIEADERGVIVAAPDREDANTWRISPKGVLILRERPYETLASAPGRHYSIELDDDGRRIRLVPFED